jgi:hypothetical protein
MSYLSEWFMSEGFEPVEFMTHISERVKSVTHEYCKSDGSQIIL